MNSNGGSRSAPNSASKKRPLSTGRSRIGAASSTYSNSTTIVTTPSTPSASTKGKSKILNVPGSNGSPSLGSSGMLQRTGASALSSTNTIMRDRLTTFATQTKATKGYIRYPKQARTMREAIEGKKEVKLSPSEYIREISMDTSQLLAKTFGGPSSKINNNINNNNNTTSTISRNQLQYTTSSNGTTTARQAASRHIQGEYIIPEIIDIYDLSDNSNYTNTIVEVGVPLFQHSPSIINFQGYEPFQTYVQALFLRNNDNVARRVRILPPESRFFSISGPFLSGVGDASNKGSSLSTSKVAPGMELFYEIKFTPEEKIDYQCDLICMTEREKFKIPVRAMGARAMLDFPDEITFGNSPVKHNTSKSFFVRNIGQIGTSFILRTQQPFTAEPSEGYLNVGDGMQITINFNPEYNGDYEMELEIEYVNNNHDKVYTKLFGVAEDVYVTLDTNSITLPSTFISLTAQQTLKMTNRSNIKVHYEWKSTATSDEENQNKLRTTMMLEQQENQEKQMALSNAGAADGDESTILNAVARKYRKLRREVAADRMLFEDEIFSIEPISGEIWPNSEVSFTVTFNPKYAAYYDRIAFCDVTGRETRLPLQMKGEGLGPKTSFSYDVLDLGDIFINSLHQYEIILENRGNIEAKYDFVPPKTLFGPKFKFTPPSGVILPYESQVIEITFCSDIIGEFSEDFRWRIQGATDDLVVHFSGRVVGPSFHFDVDEIDFGRVSYNFLNTKYITLFNTSEIPMTYTLRIPEDGALHQREFDVMPSSGTIAAHSQQKIHIDFLSNTVKRYEARLVVDVEEVGQAVSTLPIKAICIVPEILLSSNNIGFDNCFIGHRYLQTLDLGNALNLPAKYEIILPNDHSPIASALRSELGGASSSLSSVGAESDGDEETMGEHKNEPPQPVVCNVDERKGIIAPRSTHKVTISITPNILGNFYVPIYVRILGSDRPPFEVSVTGCCIGPIVAVENKLIDWDKVNVLEESTKYIKLINKSPIPALFSARLKFGSRVQTAATNAAITSGPTFRLGMTEGRMAPQEVLELPIVAYLDEIMRFTDQVIIDIDNCPEEIVVDLVAKGKGSTVTSSIQLDRVDFENQFTNRECTKKFVLTNNGRKAQTLVWTNERPQRSRKPKPGEEAPPEEEPIIFKISPERATIAGKNSCEFVITGFSAKPGEFAEKFSCRASGKGRDGRILYKTDIVGIFNVPLLEFSKNVLDFVYTFDPDSTEDYFPIQIQPLTVKNVSPLPLVFSMKPTSNGPFTIDKPDHSLSYGESATVNILFNPNYRNDFVSHIARVKLAITYKDHPQRDSVDLTANINFPNLRFDTNVIDFGCILNGSEKRIYVDLVNDSMVDAVYSWTFIDSSVESNSGEGGNSLPNNNNNNSHRPSNNNMAAIANSVDVNQVFDILPIRGVLRPNESERIEFIYYGHIENIKFHSKAVCKVEGGPSYEISLTGASSTIQYKLDKNVLDFGLLQFDKVEEKEINLFNTGKVPFKFSVDLSTLSQQKTQGGQQPKQKQIEVYPMSGRLQANDKQRLVVKFVPGIPEKIHEIFKIQVGDFDPEIVTITAVGLFPSVTVSLPRIATPEFSSCMETAREIVQTSSPFLDMAIAHLESSAQTALNTATSVQSSNPPPPPPPAATGTLAPPAAIVPPTTAAAPSTAAGLTPPLNATSGAQTITVGTSAVPASNALGPNPAPSPSSLVKIEAEAERILYKEYLLANFGGLTTTQTQKRSKTPTRTNSHISLKQATGGVVQQQQQQDPKQQQAQSTVLASFKAHPPSAGPQPFVISHYLCDFGAIIKGMSRKKTFRITNNGYLPVSFQFDKKLLSAYGFSIEPDKVKKLPGYPEHESMNFELLFQSKGKNIMDGPMSVTLPVPIRNGPVLHLELRANVIVPDVIISPSDKLEFGNVMVGQCGIITLQLHNPNVLPCDWSFSKNQHAKDGDAFVCTPNAGTLQGGERIKVQISFIPQVKKKHAAVLNLKVAQNSKVHKIYCSGFGDDIDVKIEPGPQIQLGPTLPFSHFDVPFTLRNNGTQPVEIYSIDFDDVYLEEEEILRNSDGYGAGDILLLPPRKAGEGLPADVIYAYNLKRKKEEEELLLQQQQQQQQAADANTADIIATGGIIDPATATGAASAASAASAGVGEIVTSDAASKLSDEIDSKGMIYIMYGPPLSGKTTHALKLASAFSIPILQVDQVVKLAIDSATPSDNMVIDGDLLANGSGSANDMSAGLAARKHLEQNQHLTPELVEAILRLRLRESDCTYGCIFDGIGSAYLPTQDNLELSARAVMRACGKRQVHFITLTSDKLSLHIRSILIKERRAAELLEDARVNEITEEEYDAMRDDEKQKYQAALKLFRERKKLLDSIVSTKKILLGKRDERQQQHKPTIDLLEQFKLDIEEFTKKQEEERIANEAKLNANTKNKKPPAPAKKMTPAEIEAAEKEAAAALAAATASAATAAAAEAARLGEKIDPELDDKIVSFLSSYDAVNTIFATGNQEEKPVEVVEAPPPQAAVPPVPAKGKAASKGGKGSKESEPVAPSAPPPAPVVEEPNKPEPLTHLYKLNTAEFEVEQEAHARLVAMLPKPEKPDEKKDKKPASEEKDLEVIELLIRDRIVKPAVRKPRESISKFSIITPPPPKTEVELAAEKAPTPVESPVPPPLSPSPAPVIPGKKGGKATPVPAPDPEPIAPPPPPPPVVKPPTRWVIQPNSSQELVLRFVSDETGKFEKTLTFGVVGSRHEYSLACQGVCAYPQISHFYQNIFSNRIKARPEEPKYVSKKYIMNQKVFEFGPLIIGKSRENYLSLTSTSENVEKFHITNNGLFDAEVRFCFGQQNPETEQPTFLLDPPMMTLKPEETRDVTVWCFPNQIGPITNELICTVKDNPEPFKFVLACIGSKPDARVDKSKLDFGRLLIGSSNTLALKIENTSTVPIHWQIFTDVPGSSTSAIPTSAEPQQESEFRFDSTEGILDPKAQYELKIEYKALTQSVVNKEIRILVCDTKSPMPTTLPPLPAPTSLAAKGAKQQQPVSDMTTTSPSQDGAPHLLQIPITLAAEAYAVQVQTEPKVLDFGYVKVSEGGKQVITMKNEGKYNVGFQFRMSKRLSKIFTVNPAEGVLKANDKKPTTIEILLKTTKEITLKDCTEMSCMLIDPDTKEEKVTEHIKVNVKAVFSKYSILPLHGLHFGPLVSGTSKARTFDIINNGVFEFKYNLFGLKSKDGERLEPIAPVAAAQGKDKSSSTPKKGGKAEASKPVELVLGKFTIEPAQGSIPPNGSQTVTVNFNAEGGATFHQIIGIDISDRNPSDHPHGIALDVVGESCIPGINTTDFDSVFEEQQVVSQLNVVESAAIKQLDSSRQSVFALAERVFSFGTVRVGKEIHEKFKISNPNKVPCNVEISIKPRDPVVPSNSSSSSSKEAAAAQQSPVFEIEPEKLYIPPHEHRYIRATFKPTSLENYAAIFSATVVKGEDPKTRELKFEVRGDGALPHVVIQQPARAAGANTQPMLKFPRTIVGKSSELPVVIQNEGLLPATVRFDFAHHPAFSFRFSNSMESARAQDIVIESKQTRKFVMEFRPPASLAHELVGGISSKQFDSSLNLIVLDNHFEDATINVQAEAYVEEFTFDDLPAPPTTGVATAAANDELVLADCAIGVKSQSVFTLINHTDRPARFEWRPTTTSLANVITVSPSVGHIQAQSRKNITVTFSSDTPREIKSELLQCMISKIKYVDESFADDWDNSMKSVRWESDPEKVELLIAEKEKRAKEAEAAAQQAALTAQKAAPDAKSSKTPQKPAPGAKVAKSDDMPPPPVAVPPPEIEIVQHGKKKSVKITEVDPEPEYVLLTEGSNSAAQPQIVKGAAAPAAAAPKEPGKIIKELKVSCVADYARYECATKDIKFKTTLMYQTRSFKFPIKNTGRVAFNYEFQFVDDALGVDDGAKCPFTVSPQLGVVAPNEELLVTVKMSPTEVDEYQYRLICNIPNVDPALASQPLSILVSGKSQCPLVHFELPASDYITSGRRNPELPGPNGRFGALDPQTRVIEFESHGIKVKNTKRFYVLNPTSISYDFYWKREDVTDGNTDSVFSCSTMHGVIHSGKKSEMVFEYTPESLETKESFWSFNIDAGENTVSIPFLLAGKAMEPEVYLDKARINFNTVLVGAKSREILRLVNRERIPFSFSFEKATFSSNENATVLSVTPSSGTIGAEKQIPITVVFQPSAEENYNFNLACVIKKKPTKLTCNVKGEGFAVHERIEIVGASDGTSTAAAATTTTATTAAKTTTGVAASNNTILNPGGPNRIEFGKTQINDRQVKKLILYNFGKFNYDFTWSINNPAPSSSSSSSGGNNKTDTSPIVSITPELGTVVKGEKVECELVFNPRREVTVEDCKLVCKITNGNSYVLSVSGKGSQPNLFFSFRKHDFGPCFILNSRQKHTTGVKQVALKVRNDDDKDISFDVPFENKPHLEVKASATVLKPKEERDILILFSPRELKTYVDEIPFEINGLYTVPVTIMGEGTSARVEVINPPQKTINFGALRVGERASRTIELVNKSKIPATVSLAACLPTLKNNYITVVGLNDDINKTSSSNQTSTTSTAAAAAAAAATNALNALTDFELAPKEHRIIKLLFEPKVRLNTFSEDLVAEIAGGVTKTLATLNGSCQGIEVKLDTNTVAFGPVVQHTRATRRVILENTGDVGVKFRWKDPQRFEPMFTIHPLEGFVAANSEIAMEVTFMPTKLNQDVSVENIECLILDSNSSSSSSNGNGSNATAAATATHKPLLLTLTGMCVDKPPEVEKLKFKTPVRTEQRKMIQIKNPTASVWVLKPVVDNEHWHLNTETIRIPEKDKIDLEITYKPMVMTKQDKGSLFMPLPDGHALLYTLEGEADEPAPVAEIRRELPAKKLSTEKLFVENWLKKSQRFKVTLDFPGRDEGTIIQGIDYIDVPALSKREYKFTFFAHRDNIEAKGRVTFRNEQTQEFLYYNVAFKTTYPEEIEAIVMESPVRQRVTRSIRIENPLESKSITVSVKCDADDVTVPSEFTIAPKSDATCEVKFLPLLARERTCKLTFECAELGAYPYTLKLKSLPNGPEKNMHFKVSLGSSQSQTLRFTNFLRVPTEFTCKFERGTDFVIANNAKTIKVPAVPAENADTGAEVSLDVTYEPSKLGDTKDSLVISSPQGGEYIFLLYGHCLPPRPQGPLEIRENATQSVSFKNVFPEKTTFNFFVDNPAFVVKPSEVVAGKQKVMINVTFKPQQQQQQQGTTGAAAAAAKVPPPKSAGGSGGGASAAMSLGGVSGEQLGKLIVSCAGAGEGTSPEWIYYLRGIRN